MSTVQFKVASQLAVEDRAVETFTENNARMMAENLGLEITVTKNVDPNDTTMLLELIEYKGTQPAVLFLFNSWTKALFFLMGMSLAMGRAEVEKDI